MGNISIDEDDLSDEYDFMDDDDAQEQRRRQRAQRRVPQHKYVDILQELADRKTDEIEVDLDDLYNVRAPKRRDGVRYRGWQG